jgi:hypothetical protein
MMKVIALVTVLCLGAAVCRADEIQASFVEFVKQHNRMYAGAADTLERFAYFKANYELIAAHNAKPNVSFKLGLNEYSDLSPKEFRQMSTGYNPVSAPRTSDDVHPNLGSPNDLPVSVDWRSSGAVSAIGNQGQCGSSPHWGAATSAEGYMKIRLGKPTVSLSVQQLMDCAFVGGTNQGCNGANYEPLMNFIVGPNGLCQAKDYPYQNPPGDSPCITTCKPVMKARGWWNASNEVDLMLAVAQGPVATAITADTTAWQEYAGGIFTDDGCGDRQPDHGIAVVGYGSENGKPYWILKNTWGTTWGEKGYMRILRGKNLCRIADYVYYVL